MSARIPDTMLLSDLLKATGYDCPSELQGLTFAEATVGESEIQTKEVTIVTNTETEVTPDTGKLLSKVIVTTAVGEPETQTKEVTIVSNTETEVTPDTGKLLSKVTVTTAVPNKLFAYGTAEGVVFLKAIPSEDTAEVAVYVPSATGLTAVTGSYTKETDTVTVSTDDYARYADGDFTI